MSGAGLPRVKLPKKRSAAEWTSKRRYTTLMHRACIAHSRSHFENRRLGNGAGRMGVRQRAREATARPLVNGQTVEQIARQREDPVKTIIDMIKAAGPKSLIARRGGGDPPSRASAGVAARTRVVRAASRGRRGRSARARHFVRERGRCARGRDCRYGEDAARTGCGPLQIGGARAESWCAMRGRSRPRNPQEPSLAVERHVIVNRVRGRADVYRSRPAGAAAGRLDEFLHIRGSFCGMLRR